MNNTVKNLLLEAKQQSIKNTKNNCPKKHGSKSSITSGETITASSERFLLSGRKNNIGQS
jgi:hypothetical protein